MPHRFCWTVCIYLILQGLIEEILCYPLQELDVSDNATSVIVHILDHILDLFLFELETELTHVHCEALRFHLVRTDCVEEIEVSRISCFCSRVKSFCSLPPALKRRSAMTVKQGNQEKPSGNTLSQPSSSLERTLLRHSNFREAQPSLRNLLALEGPRHNISDYAHQEAPLSICTTKSQHTPGPFTFAKLKRSGRGFLGARFCSWITLNLEYSPHWPAQHLIARRRCSFLCFATVQAATLPRGTPCFAGRRHQRGHAAHRVTATRVLHGTYRSPGFGRRFSQMQGGGARK